MDKNNWIIPIDSNGLYEGKVFICGCGRHKIVLGSDACLFYHCHCGNTDFIDVQDFENNTSIGYLENFDWAHTVEEKNGIYYYNAYYQKPYFDSQKLKISYEEVKLYEVSYNDGWALENDIPISSITSKKIVYNNQIMDLLDVFLIESSDALAHEYVKKNNELRWLLDENISNTPYEFFNAVSFFCEFPYLKNSEFLKWENVYQLKLLNKKIDAPTQLLFEVRRMRNSPFLVNAHETAYKIALESDGTYDYLFDHKCFTNIEDERMLALLISLPQCHKKIFCHNLSNNRIDDYFKDVKDALCEVSLTKFLIRNFSYKIEPDDVSRWLLAVDYWNAYREKGDFSFNKSFFQSTIENYYHCVVQEVDSIRSKQEEDYKKIMIHEKGYIDRFSYEGQHGIISIMFPVSKIQFQQWKNELIVMKKDLCYGLFINGKISYLVDINDGKIINIIGRGGSFLSVEDYNILRFIEGCFAENGVPETLMNI